MTNEELAGKLRIIAKSFEESGEYADTCYSCLAVEWTLGRAVRAAYEELMLGNGEDEPKLFGMTSRNENKQRVLMLCFAAAMAETGDL